MQDNPGCDNISKYCTVWGLGHFSGVFPLYVPPPAPSDAKRESSPDVHMNCQVVRILYWVLAFLVHVA